VLCNGEAFLDTVATDVSSFNNHTERGKCVLTQPVQLAGRHPRGGTHLWLMMEQLDE
jgi:hypothetical protein